MGEAAGHPATHLLCFPPAPAVIIISGGPNSNDFAAKYDRDSGKGGAGMTAWILNILLFSCYNVSFGLYL